MFIGDDITALIHDYTGSQGADLKLVVRVGVQTTVVNVNHRWRGAANRQIIAGRRLIGTVKLRSGKRVKAAQRRHGNQQNSADN
ncbi:Uncharacterised protein [Shigella sonnei]|nr:Uncharacterised protein [Shigella sonnei]